MRKAMFITFLLSLCITTNSFAATNVLTNGDFEDGGPAGLGGDPEYYPPGWMGWGDNGWHHNDPGHVIDTKAIKYWWDNAGIFQDFAAAPGVTYDFSVEVLNSTLETLVGWNGVIKAEFYDSSVGITVEFALIVLELDRYYSASDPVDVWITIG